jgi:hypothetical protein
MTHEQYLDEPGDTIEWMLRIDNAVRRVQEKKEREASKR